MCACVFLHGSRGARGRHTHSPSVIMRLWVVEEFWQICNFCLCYGSYTTLLDFEARAGVVSGRAAVRLGWSRDADCGFRVLDRATCTCSHVHRSRSRVDWGRYFDTCTWHTWRFLSRNFRNVTNMSGPARCAKTAAAQSDLLASRPGRSRCTDTRRRVVKGHAYAAQILYGYLQGPGFVQITVLANMLRVLTPSKLLHSCQ